MKKRTAPWLFLLPSLAGVAGCFLLPCLLTLHSSLAGELRGRGGYSLAAYGEILRNPMFRLGAGNFLGFALLAVPLTAAAALGLALLLEKGGRGALPLMLCSLLPFVIPSGATAFFWNSVFSLGGVVNRWLFLAGREPVLWDSSPLAMVIPAVVYLWKYCGFFALLLWVGLRLIPGEYYDLARLEGAGRRALFFRVTLVYLAPTLLVILPLSFVAAFGISRELSALFGRYPHQNLYLLQHFIGNHLGSMDLPVLCAATVLSLLLAMAAILPLWWAGARMADSFTRRGGRFSLSGGGRGRALLFWLLAGVFLLPVLFTLANSLMPAAEAAGRYSLTRLPQNAGGLFRGGLHFVEPALLPARPTLEQYRELFREPGYLRMLGNSLGVALPVLLLHPAVSAAGGYGFFRGQGKRGLSVLFGIYLVVMLLPVQVMITPQYLMFRELGLLGTALPVVVPAVFHPAGVFLVRLQLAGFPEERIEAARLDGAGEFTIFWRVVLPEMRGSVALAVVYSFGECWNGIDQAVVFLGGGERATLAAALGELSRGGLGAAAAASMVYLAPACLVFALCLWWAKRGAEE